MIPYGHQTVDEDDIQAVIQVLRGDWLTQGPLIAEFEAELCEMTGAAYSVAYSSGTAALHGACAAARLGPGDLVVTSPLTFVASANCARYVGASVGLVDIDPQSLNIDLSRVPTEASAVIPVHYAGLPVDMSRLNSRPRVVIEDACHALGAMTPDGPVGNCAHSDMTVFSFHPVKAITAGEGGAVTTNNAGLADRLRRFRSHGTIPAPENGPWAYDVAEVGFNYRLTDIQAALAVSQITKLGQFVLRRQELAARYRALLSHLPVELPPEPNNGFTHAYHLFPIRVNHRDDVYVKMRDLGIGVQVHYVPVHHHSSFGGLGLHRHLFPATERAYSRLLSLPLFPGLTERQQSEVVSALEAAL